MGRLMIVYLPEPLLEIRKHGHNVVKGGLRRAAKHFQRVSNALLGDSHSVQGA